VQQDVFVDMTGARSVPRVFIDGKFIGGGDDVVKLMKSGELAKMV
jgi:glutaredoxin 3